MHVMECNKAGCGFQELLVGGGAAQSPLPDAGADMPWHGTPTVLPGAAVLAELMVLTLEEGLDHTEDKGCLVEATRSCSPISIPFHSRGFISFSSSVLVQHGTASASARHAPSPF